MLKKASNYTAFAISLAVICVLNCIGIIAVNTYFQYVSILFSLWACFLFGYKFFREEHFIEAQSSMPYALILTLCALFTWMANGFINPKLNIYAILSVFINFAVLLIMQKEPSAFIKILKTLNPLLFLYLLASLLFTLFRISIPINNATSIYEKEWMGIEQYSFRIMGLSSNPNILARVALCAILVSVFVLFVIKKGKFQRIVAVADLVLALYMLLLSESRGGIYSFIIGAGISGLVYFMFFFPRSVVKKCAGSLAVVLCSLFLLSFHASIESLFIKSIPNLSKGDATTDVSDNDAATDISDNTNDPVNRYEFAGGSSSDPTTGRALLLTTALKATVKKNLLFGLTYGNYSDSVKQYVLENKYTIPEHLQLLVGSTHNTLAQFFVCYGLCGSIVLLAFLLYLLKLLYRLLFVVKCRDAVFFIPYLFVFVSCASLSMVERVFFLNFDNEIINFFLLVSVGSFIGQVQARYSYAIVKTRVTSLLSKPLYLLRDSVNKVFVQKER